MYYKTSTLCQVLGKKFLAFGVHEPRLPAKPEMGHARFLILGASGSVVGKLDDPLADPAVRLVDVTESTWRKPRER